MMHPPYSIKQGRKMLKSRLCSRFYCKRQIEDISPDAHKGQ